MVKAHWGVGLTAVGLVLCTALSSASAQTTKQKQIESMLGFRPKQEGIDYTTPSASELKDCDVKLIGGTKPGSSGWLFKDGRGRALRRFFDSNGDRHIDIWSYFKDGLEVYREIDTNFNKRPDQYRWLNHSGMKWGVDINEDGLIDSWKAISSDEAALEAFHAVMNKDFRRLKAVMISESELKSLGLPAAFVDRIRTKLKHAPTKFQETLEEIPDTTSQNVVGRLESAPPQCVPGESLGANHDLYRHPTRTVLFETSEKNHEWLQTGEMLKVGNAWRLLDVPSPGTITPPTKRDPELQKLLDQLADLDGDAPEVVGPGPNKAVELYNQKRVALIEQIVRLVPGEERATWLRQIADNLAAASIHSESITNPHLNRLRQYQGQMAQQSPRSNLAGYFTFRSLWAEYTPKLSSEKYQKDLPKIQSQWLEELADFVQHYPNADDTPDALIQLAMGSEFNGKEDEAKRYYQQMVSNFPGHMFAPKAAGAIRRLGLVGNKMDLSAKTLSGNEFSIASLRGKVVAVYYWASYCSTCESTFAKLKKLREEYGPKGFEIVSVNLDDQQANAVNFLRNNPLPGIHLYHWTQGDGLSSPLANYYGIIGLPSLFLVGEDGKVISRTIQINDLEDTIQKEL